MKLDKRQYYTFGNIQIYFPKKDVKKIERMSDKIVIISTVCPDYPNEGGQYTFRGELGKGISLTAWQHLKLVPSLVKHLEALGREVVWTMLVADLPELTQDQQEFYERVAGSAESYIERCADSVKTIQTKLGSLGRAESFSSFYGKRRLPYLEIQQQVAQNILQAVGSDDRFAGKFQTFRSERRLLAELFRGRKLSTKELDLAAAHGMSLYITHGTLLRHIFEGQNLVAVNHLTLNLQNFFLYNFVDGFSHLQNSPKFPIGIIEGDLY